MIYIKKEQIPVLVRAVAEAAQTNPNRTELLLNSNNCPDGYVRVGFIQDGTPVMDFDFFTAITRAKY